MPVRPALIPVLRYADAPAAIDFLCSAFGFTRHAVYANPEDPDRIDHAELAWNGYLVMLSTVADTPFVRASRTRTAAEAGGVTQSLYLVIDDVDGHAATAAAAGADIFLPPEDQPYGGRSYSARDPEGNVWTFGSYDPAAG
ncbi:VOC family protein [Sphingomonas sp. ac-8]|uniref:VOC family protein n=1 Tax=Sphingomonas sp. ac-8 TaxID=3242977 RepID=UPI003A812726